MHPNLVINGLRFWIDAGSELAEIHFITLLDILFRRRHELGRN